MFKNSVSLNRNLKGTLVLYLFLTPSRNTIINSFDLLKEAVENFEEFLVLVLGK